MAIYHLEAKVITRSVGRTACAAAAYQSCSRIYNDYDGVQHDYTRKGGLVWERVFLPPMAPSEWQDREVLWNAVEAGEKAKDSQLARVFNVALPVELKKEHWIELVSDFIQEQFVSDGMCADAAIHDMDGHNPHAHILLTMRPLNGDGTWQHKTEKEYICIRSGEERGFTAAEFKAAQAEGWEKQYLYKVGKERLYLPPSLANARGFERVNKYPYSTKYGRQNPITARWNSDEQLIAWREAWADVVNRALERSGVEQRIDHRSNAERGLDEKPTIHEGPSARKLEAAGYVSERCELNRQIKADNALIRTLKAQVKKLVQAVKNTIPALAEAMEAVRGKMILFMYQLRFIAGGKNRLSTNLDILNDRLEKYVNIAGEIKEKSKDRSVLLAEKKATPVINILKHRELSRRIAELAEELEELRSEKARLLAYMEYASDTPISAVRKDVAAIEADLKKLEQQEQKYTAELNTALSEYEELKAQAADFDPDELAMAQLAIRPETEAAVRSKVKEVCGDKYDFWTMADAEKDVSKMLNEENPHIIRERVRLKEYERQMENRESVPQDRKKERKWER